MYVSVGFALGALALVHEVASYSLFGHKGIVVAQRHANATEISPQPQTSSTIPPPCTTTVTSVLGERFISQTGSCSKTITVTSIFQPTESSAQSTQSKTPVTFSSPSTVSGTLILTKSSTGTEESSTSNLVPSSSLPVPVDCTTTITSIFGQRFVPGMGPCGQTVTIVSTMEEFSVSKPTRSEGQASTILTNTVQTPTLAPPFPTNQNPSPSANAPPTLASSTTSSSPLSTSKEKSEPGSTFGQESSTVAKQPSFPSQTREELSLPASTKAPSLGDPTTNPNASPGTPMTNSPGSEPKPTTPHASFTIPILDPGPSPPGQQPQPTPETTSSKYPVGPIPESTTQTRSAPSETGTPEAPAPPTATTSQGILSQEPISTPSISDIYPITQASQPVLVPTPSKSIPSPPCATGCTETYPTTQESQPVLIPTTSRDIPNHTLAVTIPTETPASQSQFLHSNSEQVPTATDLTPQFPDISSAEGSASTLSPPLPIISNNTPAGPIVFGSQTISQDAASNFIFGSQTLVPGSAITVKGQQISAAASGGAIILNPAPPQSNSAGTPASSTGPAPAVVIVGSTRITADPSSGFVIGSQTLFPGSAITASGQVITLPAPTPTITQSPSTIPVIIFGTSTFTQNPSSAFIIGTQTLSPGSAITISGQVISLSPTGNAVILNGATQRPTTFSTEIQAPVTSLVVAGQTLTAGGRVTVGGDVLSLAGGAITVIGTVTVGGGEATATATPTGKKNAGRRIGIGSTGAGWLPTLVIGIGFWGLF